MYDVLHASSDSEGEDADGADGDNAASHAVGGNGGTDATGSVSRTSSVGNAPAIPERRPWHGARFRPNFPLEDAIGSDTCSLQANMRVTNDISSRVSTPLTGWHCKMRPNTEGAL
jgi:hypothetical protein